MSMYVCEEEGEIKGRVVIILLLIMMDMYVYMYAFQIFVCM